MVKIEQGVMIEYQQLFRPHKRSEVVKSYERLRLETVIHIRKGKRMAEFFDENLVRIRYSIFSYF